MAMAVGNTEHITVNDDDETSYFLSSQYNHNKGYKLKRINKPVISRWKSKWSTKTIKKSFWRRLPKTKPILSILLINCLQSYAFLLVTDILTLENSVYNVVSSNEVLSSVIMKVVIIGLPSIFYPLGGILGDVHIGRQAISHVCLFIMWIMSILFTIILVVCSYFSDNQYTNLIIPVFLLIIMAVVDGIFQINWLTFGADQLCNSPTEEVGSFIYSFYWTKNIGIVAAIATNTILSRVSTSVAGRGGFSPLVATTALTITLLIHRTCKGSFDIDRRNINPIKHICGVLINASTSRPSNPFISAFRYGEDPPSGLEYARQYHGGKYTDEQVEDVRTFHRIFLFIMTLSGFMITYAAFLNMMNYQLKKPNELAYLAQQLSTVTVDVTVIILLPLWNLLIFPIMSNYLPNSRKRIGIGLAMSTLALIGATLIHKYDSTATTILLIPSIAMGIAEASVFVPILEFIYAQSPENMKGMLIGWHYFLIGVWSAVAIAIFVKCQQFTSSLILWYYASFSIVSLLGLILFGIVSCCYKNRQRNNPISDIMRISRYYE